MENALGNWGSKILVTRVTAAIFHGVYMGYYIFFLISYVFTISIDSLRKVLPTYEKIQENEKIPDTSIFAYIVYVSWGVVLNLNAGLVAHWALNLNTREVIKLMSSVYWIPVWINFVMLIISKVMKLCVEKEEEKRKKVD